MRIVLDLQGVQTESAFQITASPSLLFAQAVVRNRGEHEIMLALNGLFPETVGIIRTVFHHLLPQENIRVWYSPGPVCACEPANKWRRDVAERVREASLAHLKPDVVFIPTLVDGYENESVISFCVFPNDFKTIVGVENLETLRASDVSSSYGKYRQRWIEQLTRTDIILAIPPLIKDQVLHHFEKLQVNIKVDVMASDFEANQTEPDAQAKSFLKLVEELPPRASPWITAASTRRLKLAYVSPLPPMRSGIAGYSAELLPELARYYDIDVVVEQTEISIPWILDRCGVKTADWVLKNADHYDRVLYHFGNSSYHQHMFDMLVHVPGVIVVHDFYLGDILNYLEVMGIQEHALSMALYKSHGYAVVAERLVKGELAHIVGKYPANLMLLQMALGVIVHSEYSRNLTNIWYGKHISNDVTVIPLLRVPRSDSAIGRDQARKILALEPGDFLVCSFGLSGAAKLNHRLLEAWLASALARDHHCSLVFVGEPHGGEYGVQLKEAMQASGLGQRVRITGWVDTAQFEQYLAAADMAVQLRSFSRGETSAAVLDCMNYGLATIVNAHGSFAELPVDAVCMLPENFENSQLVEALERLWKNKEERLAIGQRGHQAILDGHAPSACAEQYVKAIEHGHTSQQGRMGELIQAIAELKGHTPSDVEYASLAQSIAQSLPNAKATRQLLVDVSATCRNDLKTGIQRVVRALVWELIQSPPIGYRVEPVYLTNEGGGWHYRYARDWTSNACGFSGGWMPDEPIENSAGDILLMADFISELAGFADQAGVYDTLKRHGVGLHFFVYDLLPIQMPQYFPPGQFGYTQWLNTLTRLADSAICISHTVAEDLKSWMRMSGPPRQCAIDIQWVHLGANIENSIPSHGVPQNSAEILSKIRAVPSFLMVGTIEPRKGYLQTISAFEQLWQDGNDINLVIVGREGWIGLPDDMRHAVQKVVTRLRNSTELGKRFIWLEGISDEYLNQIYAESTCLIAASEGEGFGLPLIEAAQHKIPMMVRDIPIFREVVGVHAYYFKGIEPEQISHAITSWLDLNKTGEAPASCGIPWITWKQSVESLLDKMGLSQSFN